MSPTSCAVDAPFPGFFVDPLMEGAIKDLLQYVKKHGRKYYIEAIDNLVLSCPYSSESALVDGTFTVTIKICLNVTGLILTPPRKVSPLRFKHANCGCDSYNHTSLHLPHQASKSEGSGMAHFGNSNLLRTHSNNTFH